MNKITYKNLAAFHPSYYIKEIIEETEITQSEFAKIGYHRKNFK